MLKKGK